MHVISRKILREFGAKYRDADAPLNAWFKLARASKAVNLSELKGTFGSVDYVSTAKGNFHVFNIGGNKYRLIGVVHYRTQKLFIRHVLTHKEYDGGLWK